MWEADHRDVEDQADAGDRGDRHEPQNNASEEEDIQDSAARCIARTSAGGGTAAIQVKASFKLFLIYNGKW